MWCRARQYPAGAGWDNSGSETKGQSGEAPANVQPLQDGPTGGEEIRIFKALCICLDGAGGLGNQ